ncbi:ankyrin repeat domain-containing protein [Virgisporangium ochraceum]|uniref:ankyrin repeat domain-containing protein n=1 Tax=Virgisporangium ochraceum TaxID=65505 RepID=UPI001942FE5A|nr:ankyrin repeat domain-containing protein [Virgisporangium ochraceum]
MNATRPPPLLRDAVPGWLAARRHAVPAAMVDRATRRRLSGDWRGACAQTRFDVEVDPAGVRNRYGAEVADRLGDDLRHLVPDLVRWHLPREVDGGYGRVLAERPIGLAWYGTGPDAPALWVHTPAHLERPSRPRLRFGPLDRALPVVRTERWDRVRDLWDARATGALLTRLTGGGDRTPFHRRDGRPLGTDELPTADPGPGDPAARVEWMTLLLDAGRTDDAWAAVGIAADLLPREREYDFITHRLFTVRHPMLVPLAAELRHQLDSAPPPGGTAVFALGNPDNVWESVAVRVTPDGWTATVEVTRTDASVRNVPRASWQRLPDLDLLRTGRLGRDGLHPLVDAALFPDAADTVYDPRGRIVAPDAVRVRCGGGWHRIGWRDGRVDALDHAPEEAARERTMRALGGTVPACFEVATAWVGVGGTAGWASERPDDVGRLPRRLRRLRRDAFAAIDHGDTAAFLDLLDAGTDPTGLRNRRHRTPLHLLAHLDGPGVDIAALVRRLVDAGLDLDAADAFGRTPLCTAVFDGAPATLVRALLDAGADPTRTDGYGCSALHLLRSASPADAATILPWLLDAGLGLEDTNDHDRTPLVVQVYSQAPPATLRAMLDAGAEPVTEDVYTGDTLAYLLRRYYRYDDVSFVPLPEEQTDE